MSQGDVYVYKYRLVYLYIVNNLDKKWSEKQKVKVGKVQG